MKKTILNSLLLSAKLFFLSLILQANPVSGYYETDFSSRNNTDTNVSSEILNTSVYDQSNDRITFSDTGNYFIVLKNNHNCLDCFRDLNNYIRIIKDSLHAKYILITLIDSTTLDRKRNYLSCKSIMPDFDEFYFQYKNQYLKSFFEELNINYSPEILIVSHGKITHIPNQKIFDYPSENISIDTQLIITKFLK